MAAAYGMSETCNRYTAKRDVYHSSGQHGEGIGYYLAALIRVLIIPVRSIIEVR